MFISNKNQSTACQKESRQELVCVTISGNRTELNSSLNSNDSFSNVELPLIIFQKKNLTGKYLFNNNNNTKIHSDCTHILSGSCLCTNEVCRCTFECFYYVKNVMDSEMLSSSDITLLLVLRTHCKLQKGKEKPSDPLSFVLEVRFQGKIMSIWLHTRDLWHLKAKSQSGTYCSTYYYSIHEPQSSGTL